MVGKYQLRIEFKDKETKEKIALELQEFKEQQKLDFRTLEELEAEEVFIVIRIIANSLIIINILKDWLKKKQKEEKFEVK